MRGYLSYMYISISIKSEIGTSLSWDFMEQSEARNHKRLTVLHFQKCLGGIGTQVSLNLELIEYRIGCDKRLVQGIWTDHVAVRIIMSWVMGDFVMSKLTCTW
jgi:hypothetical protein